MPSDYLSSGTKTLINIYYRPELQFNGSMMGNNCVPLLMEIVRVQDVHIMLEHFMNLRDEDMEYVTVDRQRVTMYEYECKYSEWVDTCSEEYYEKLAAGIPVMPVKPVMDWD